MDTVQKVRIYNVLDAAKFPDLAQAFYESNTDDEVFSSLVKLRNEMVPAFVEAFKQIRDEV